MGVPELNPRARSARQSVTCKASEVTKPAVPQHQAMLLQRPRSSSSSAAKCTNPMWLMTVLASASDCPNGGSACSNVSVAKRRAAPHECWGHEGTSPGTIAPTSPTIAGRKSSNSSKLVAGRHRCLICTEVLPEKSNRRFVRKVFGQLWLCTACMTEADASPLKTQGQALDMKAFATKSMHAACGKVRSSSAPGLRLRAQERGAEIGCKICQKRLRRSDRSPRGSAHVSAGLCSDCFSGCDFKSKPRRLRQRKSTPRILLDELLLPECIVDGESPGFVI